MTAARLPATPTEPKFIPATQQEHRNSSFLSKVCVTFDSKILGKRMTGQRLKLFFNFADMLLLSSLKLLNFICLVVQCSILSSC